MCADISDVTAAISTLVNNAVYPNGISQPSVSGGSVRIYEGWPIPAQLDADMTAQAVNVSIFPMMGTSGGCYQPLNRYDTLVSPVHGMTVSVSNIAVTLSGTPGTGEYCSLVVDGLHVYSETGATAAAILSKLLADLIGTYPSASIAGNVLTITGAHLVYARIGASGVIGNVTHRQKQGIMITTWAPTPALRSTVAAPIEVILSQNQHLLLGDGSWATLLFNRLNVIDTYEAMTVYRRDLIYDAEYATVPRYTAYEVTSIQETISDNINNPTIAN